MSLELQVERQRHEAEQGSWACRASFPRHAAGPLQQEGLCFPFWAVERSAAKMSATALANPEGCGCTFLLGRGRDKRRARGPIPLLVT